MLEANQGQKSARGAPWRSPSAMTLMPLSSTPRGARSAGRCSTALIARTTYASLRSRLEHQVERGLGGTPEMPEPGRPDDLLDPGRPGLRAQRQADVLGERRGRAEQRREPVVGAADRVEV